MKPQHGFLGFLGQIFRVQSGWEARCGRIYVPHDVEWAWIAAFLGQVLTPSLVNSLIAGKTSNALAAALIIFGPWLSKVAGLRKRVNKATLDADGGNQPEPEACLVDIQKDLCNVCAHRVRKKARLRHRNSATAKKFVAA